MDSYEKAQYFNIHKRCEPCFRPTVRVGLELGAVLPNRGQKECRDGGVQVSYCSLFIYKIGSNSEMVYIIWSSFLSDYSNQRKWLRYKLFETHALHPHREYVGQQLR
jgi:hypothetical protein